MRLTPEEMGLKPEDFAEKPKTDFQRFEEKKKEFIEENRVVLDRLVKGEKINEDGEARIVAEYLLLHGISPDELRDKYKTIESMNEAFLDIYEKVYGKESETSPSKSVEKNEVDELDLLIAALQPIPGEKDPNRVEKLKKIEDAKNQVNKNTLSLVNKYVASVNDNEDNSTTELTSKLRGKRKAELRDAFGAAKRGEVSEEQAEILSRCGMDVESLGVSVVEKENKNESKSETGKNTESGVSRRFVDSDTLERLDNLIKNPSRLSVKLIETILLKAEKDGRSIPTDLYQAAVDAVSKTEVSGKVSPEQQYRNILNSGAEPKDMERALSQWYNRRISEGGVSSDLMDAAKKQLENLRLKALKPEIAGLPELDDNEGWLVWGRKQLIEYLDPKKQGILAETKGNNVFRIEKESSVPGVGKTYVDALTSMPEEAKNVLMKEQKMVFELRKLYFKWNVGHKGFGNMSSLLDVKEESDNRYYSLPNNEQLASVFNDLADENFREREGSKRVSKAVSIYYEMASSRQPIDVKIDGVDVRIPCIFNTQLSDEELKQARSNIARLCGGEYYESIGLIMSKFFGFAARGCDNTTPAVENADIMGRLIWTDEINSWGNEQERRDAAKRAGRWLPDEVANDFTDDNGRSIEISVDLVSLQNSGSTGERNYYLVRDNNNRIRVEKKINGFTDTGISMQEVIKAGRLCDIDWSASKLNPMALVRYQEGQAVNLYTMFNSLIAEKQLPTTTDTEFTKKMDLINTALARYPEDVRKKIGYLYVKTIINRHSYKFLERDKGKEAAKKEEWDKLTMRTAISNAKKSGIITGKQARKLESEFRAGYWTF